MGQGQLRAALNAELLSQVALFAGGDYRARRRARSGGGWHTVPRPCASGGTRQGLGTSTTTAPAWPPSAHMAATP
jgi:hypothetical protein